MTKTEKQSMSMINILILIFLAILVGYLFYMKKNPQPDTLAPNTETYTSPSDLDQARDQLESVNVDSVDVGINELNQGVY